MPEPGPRRRSRGIACAARDERESAAPDRTRKRADPAEAQPRRILPGAATLVVDVLAPCREWRRALPGAAAQCRRAARAAMALGAPAVDDAEISIVLGDDRLLRRLNGAWRGKDEATNVLSFPAQPAVRCPLPRVPGMARPFGDVVLAFETIRAEAAAQGKALADHLAHLVVHGVLHLLGFDHVAAVEARRMERLERRILAGLGIADPYLGSPVPHG